MPSKCGFLSGYALLKRKWAIANEVKLREYLFLCKNGVEGMSLSLGTTAVCI